MLEAAYCAGIAFSRSYVGYVHAIAHSLGGQYGVAHGLANAVILPYFLRGIRRCLCAAAGEAGALCRDGAEAYE